MIENHRFPSWIMCFIGYKMNCQSTFTDGWKCFKQLQESDTFSNVWHLQCSHVKSPCPSFSQTHCPALHVSLCSWKRRRVWSYVSAKLRWSQTCFSFQFSKQGYTLDTLWNFHFLQTELGGIFELNIHMDLLFTYVYILFRRYDRSWWVIYCLEN